MNRLKLTLVITILYGCFSYSQETIAYKDVHVMRINWDEILEHQDVLVYDKKIVAISPTNDLPYQEGIQVIECAGKYILPGLSEMHAHIPLPEDGDDSYVKDVMMLFLAHGVTVIRGMLGDPYHLSLKEQVASGQVLGPRIYTSSPSLNGNSVPTAQEAIDKVRQYATEGYDFLKIHPGIKADVMEALVGSAKESSIRFAGHVPVDVGIERALDYGYWAVDHLDGFVEGLVQSSSPETINGGFFGYAVTDKTDLSKLEDLSYNTKINGVWMVPTQSLFTRWFSPERADLMMQAPEMSYLPAKTRFAWRGGKERLISDPSYNEEQYHRFLNLRKEIIRALDQNGVGFLLGSDSPQVMNVPGFSIHHEIDALIDAGMGVKEVLLSGTVNPAIFFGMEGEFGSVVEGADADFIIVDENPLENVKTLRNPVGVSIQGKWLSREFLKYELEKIADKNKD